MRDEKGNYRYHVKWQSGGNWHYGLFQKQEGETVIVADAIKPITLKIPAKDVIDIDPSGYPNEYDQFLEKAADEAQKRSEALGEGLVVGKIFHLPVADGCAHYEITAIKSKMVAIEWRGYCPDRWTDHWLGWGGNFSKTKIAEIIRRQEGMARLFASVPVKPAPPVQV